MEQLHEQQVLTKKCLILIQNSPLGPNTRNLRVWGCLGVGMFGCVYTYIAVIKAWPSTSHSSCTSSLSFCTSTYVHTCGTYTSPLPPPSPLLPLHPLPLPTATTLCFQPSVARSPPVHQRMPHPLPRPLPCPLPHPMESSRQHSPKRGTR